MPKTRKTAPEAVTPPQEDFRPAPGLEGITGRLRVEVQGNGAAILEVKEGRVRILPAGRDDAVTATVTVDSEETLRALRGGRLNPVVAALRGHLEIKGDLDLAIRTILGLHVAHPFAGDARQGG